MMIVGVVFLVMILAVLAMAVGVLVGRKSLQGSCGGLQTIQGIDCMVCPTPCETDEEESSCPHGKKNSQSPNMTHVSVNEDLCPNKKSLPSKPLVIEGAPCN